MVVNVQTTYMLLGEPSFATHDVVRVNGMTWDVNAACNRAHVHVMQQAMLYAL